MVPAFFAADKAARGSRAPAPENPPFRPLSAAVSGALDATGLLPRQPGVAAALSRFLPGLPRLPAFHVAHVSGDGGRRTNFLGTAPGRWPAAIATNGCS